MTEFRFPPIKLPASTGVDPVLACMSAMESEFRAARGAFPEPAPHGSRPRTGQQPASAETRSRPLSLPEPAGRRFPAPPRTISSCCTNCDQGLPCESMAGASCSKHNRGCQAVAPAGSQCAPSVTAADDTTVPVLDTPLRAEIRQPFWKPMDIEAKFKPIRLCCNKDPETGKCEPVGQQPCVPDDDEGDDDKPVGHCGPVRAQPFFIFNSDSRRCALNACNAAFYRCLPIPAEPYSSRSRAQVVLSRSRWKDGVLESADCSLIRAIAYHIDMTTSGDEVLIAISAWSDVAWGIATSVIAAKKRGVTVRVISGNSGEWARTGDWIRERLLEALGSTHFKLWDGQHYPFKGQISHNKFVLIKRKAEKQRLVLIGGANWARFDIARNCDLLTVNSEVIWSAFRQYFLALWAASPDTVIFYPPQAADLDTGVTAQFWPILDAFGAIEPGGFTDAKNPFCQIIQKYRQDKTTKIRIIASHWWRLNKDGVATGPGSSLLKLLKSHREQGSDVRVIGNHHRDTGCHTISQACEVKPNKGGEIVAPCETQNAVWQYLDTHNIAWAKCPPHAKVLLISGVRTSDNKWHQDVFTGSMNMSYEVGMPDAIIGIHDDSEIFSQYENWWNWLCHNTAISRGGGVFVCGDFPVLNNG